MARPFRSALLTFVLLLLLVPVVYWWDGETRRQQEATEAPTPTRGGGDGANEARAANKTQENETMLPNKTDVGSTAHRVDPTGNVTMPASNATQP